MKSLISWGRLKRSMRGGMMESTMVSSKASVMVEHTMPAKVV